MSLYITLASISVPLLFVIIGASVAIIRLKSERPEGGNKVSSNKVAPIITSTPKSMSDVSKNDAEIASQKSLPNNESMSSAVEDNSNAETETEKSTRRQVRVRKGNRLSNRRRRRIRSPGIKNKAQSSNECENSDVSVPNNDDKQSNAESDPESQTVFRNKNRVTRKRRSTPSSRKKRRHRGPKSARKGRPGSTRRRRKKKPRMYEGDLFGI